MEVQIPCPCPRLEGQEPRHESDTLYLKDVLGFHDAMTVTNSVKFIPWSDPESRAAEVLATLSEFYVLVGIERWTLRDAANKPLEVTKANIRQRILERPDIAALVVDEADALYHEAILIPLVTRGSESLQLSPTEPSMSPKPAGKRAKPPKQSKPSSISTIPTDATAMTSESPDGAYSSSQNLELAG